MGEVYVWSEMDAGNSEAPRGKGKFDIETGWAQKVVERYAPTYLSSPSQVFSGLEKQSFSVNVPLNPPITCDSYIYIYIFFFKARFKIGGRGLK